MALRVVNNYRPAGLTVKRNTGIQYGANPQVTRSPQATRSPQVTASPQRTAPVSFGVYNRPNINPNWGAEQAARMNAEADRARLAAQVQKRRLADAKNNELKVVSGGFGKQLFDKATFGNTRRQRGGRELAYYYWKENEGEWGTHIMARQRRYETEGARLKDWVMQSKTEDEYNQRVKEATAWFDKEYNEITADIKDFQLTQLELANYAQSPLSGKAASMGRFAKNFIGGVGNTSWNALTWTTSQPQRLVNTVKNIAAPNNVRTYYGGEEKSGGITNPNMSVVDRIKAAYNASKDQRNYGMTKEEEERRLQSWTKQITLKDGSKRTVTRTPSAVDKFRVRYGDDILDNVLDPMTWFAGAGAASKAGKVSNTSRFTSMVKNKLGDKFYDVASKNKWLRERVIADAFDRQVNPNRFVDWLRKPEGTKMSGFFNDNKEMIARRKQLSEMIDSLIDSAGGRELLKRWKNVKNSAFNDTELGRRFKTMTDEDAELLERFMNYTTYADDVNPTNVMKQQFSWENVKLPRNLSKERRRFIEDTARALKRHTDWLHSKDIEHARYNVKQFSGTARRQAERQLKDVYKAYRKSYIPGTRDFSNAKPFEEALKTTGDSRWFNKAQKRIKLQSAEELFGNISKRTSATMRNITPFAKDIKFDQLEGLSDLIAESQKLSKTLGVRKQSYKSTKLLDKINDFSLNNRKFTPTGIWKKFVLGLNPAWYVNNIGWNIPASISAGGVGVIPEYLKMIRKGKKIIEQAPEGVRSNVSDMIGQGRLARFASRIEDTSRVATYNALRKKGFGEEQARKQVNRWLFDYSTKNWERPIKSVLPFWNWQKNIVRLGTTMPFHSPRSAKTYSELYKKFYQRPYEQLPNEETTYEDPETGKEVTYNPRDAYKGKAKIGDKWYGLPFFAVNPETALQFGVNPFMASGMDYMTGTDRFERSNTDRSGFSILGERFPQYNLGRSFVNRDNKDSRFWFSKSNKSKMSQGYDPSATNYSEQLDNKAKFGRQLKSFFGVPRGVKFDEDEYYKKKRLTSFSKDYFAVDWDKRLEQLKDEYGDTYKGYDDPNSPYNVLQREQESIAKKYGLDLKKDIYDGYWSKYDTENTKQTKRLKEEANEFNSGFWRDYLSQPVGSKTSPSKRRPFLIGKYREWARDHTFAKNPYYKIPEFSVYDDKGNKTNAKKSKNPFVLESEEARSVARRAEGKRKYQRYLQYQKAQKSGDWSWFERNGRKTKQTPFTYDGKFFKSQESMDRYIKGSLWAKYYELPKSQRKSFLDANPQLEQYDTPTTPEEWTALRTKLRLERQEKTKGIAGFDEWRQDIVKRIEKNKPRNFGRSRRIRYKG